MKKLTRYAPALFLLVIIIGRLIHIAEPFWYDEAFVGWVSGLPFDKMLAAVAGDVHPPLYYLVQWAIGQISTAPAIMRLPSVAYSLISLWALWQLLGALGIGQLPQRIAVIIMALAPFQLAYAQEARMYTMLQMWVLLTALAAAHRRPGMGALAAVGLVYTHHYGWLYLAAILLAWASATIADRRYRDLPGVVGVGLVAVISYLPWITYTIAQTVQFQAGHWLWLPTAADVLDMMGQLIFVKISVGEWQALLLVLAGLAASVAFYPWLVQKIFSRTLSPTIVLLVWLMAAPIAGALVVSYAWRPIFMARPLIGVAPFFYTLLAMAIADLPRSGRVGATLAILPGLVMAVPHSAREALLVRSRAPYVASIIAARWQPGDVVLHTSLTTQVELHGYLPAVDQYMMRPLDQGGLGWGYSPSTRAALGIREIDPNTLPPVTGRVFLINAWVPGTDAQHAPDYLLARNHFESLTYFENYAQNVEVYLLWPR